jgi:hypothetical protein
MTSGGWDRSHVRHLRPTWDQGVLRELFEIEVFRFLCKRELLSRERMELILSWPHYDKISLSRVAGYMLRASVVMSRISYDRDHGTVRIDPHGPHSEGPIELDVLDFIARLSVHIPEPHERLVLYYSLYSNASRPRRVPCGRDKTSVCPADHSDLVYHRSDGYRQDTPAHRFQARRHAASAHIASFSCPRRAKPARAGHPPRTPRLFVRPGTDDFSAGAAGGLNDAGPPAIRRHPPDPHVRNCVDLTSSGRRTAVRVAVAARLFV